MGLQLRPDRGVLRLGGGGGGDSLQGGQSVPQGGAVVSGVLHIGKIHRQVLFFRPAAGRPGRHCQQQAGCQ